jgi:4,5-DOPA dioxygenase extradiol
MKTLFIGHGSPENALAHNRYTEFLSGLGALMSKPKAIVVFSAHWLTHGTYITGNSQPPQIYDFYGFPESLYRVQYCPPGSRELAETISGKIPEIRVDYSRGIDHAAWAVIRHIYPAADIPVLEMSLNRDLPESDHFRLGTEIASLGLSDVLFIGSGNAIHNLSLVDFSPDPKPYSWAVATNSWLADRLENNRQEELLGYKKFMPDWQRAVPTDDHYLPLLYVLGMRTSETKILFNELQNASISMLAFSVS